MLLENTRESVWNQLNVRDWGLNEISHYLLGSGYTSDDIIDANFDEINKSGSAVFKIEYIDNFTGDADTGLVFLSIDKGRIVADF